VHKGIGLPFSQASENNKIPIFKTIRPYLSQVSTVFEVGSGTAQHGEYFAEKFPGLVWQCSEVPEGLEITQQRIRAKALPNLPAAKALDVNYKDWNCKRYECVFSANSLHIMSANSMVNFFRGVNQCMEEFAWLLLYGPFKYNGKFTTESNARFDDWLKQRDPASGVRDFEKVQELAATAGLSLQEDNPMPANNQLLVFKLS
tara:strand:+ start:709 stop:1314 length:606 start_codon:yes stop_codon:yes gene_type:complete